MNDEKIVRFVRIRGGDPDRALAELNALDIPTLGPTSGRVGAVEITGSDEMFAVLDARTAEEAEALVKDALPADGGYAVSPAEPFARRD